MSYSINGIKYNTLCSIYRETKSWLLIVPYNGIHKHLNFKIYLSVHRCGASGSMRACHATGPGSIPGRDRFPG